MSLLIINVFKFCFAGFRPGGEGYHKEGLVNRKNKQKQEKGLNVYIE